MLTNSLLRGRLLVRIQSGSPFYLSELRWPLRGGGVMRFGVSASGWFGFVGSTVSLFARVLRLRRVMRVGLCDAWRRYCVVGRGL